MNGTNNIRARHGVSLVELVAALVVCSVILAISVPVYLNQRRVAWRETVETDVTNAAMTLERQGARRDADMSAIVLAGSPISSNESVNLTARTSTSATQTRYVTKATPAYADAGRLSVSGSDQLRVTITNQSYTIVGIDPVNLPGWKFSFTRGQTQGQWRKSTGADVDITPGGFDPTTPVMPKKYDNPSYSDANCVISNSYTSKTSTKDYTDSTDKVADGITPLNLQAGIMFNGCGMTYQTNTTGFTLSAKMTNVSDHAITAPSITFDTSRAPWFGVDLSKYNVHMENPSYMKLSYDRDAQRLTIAYDTTQSWHPTTLAPGGSEAFTLILPTSIPIPSDAVDPALYTVKPKVLQANNAWYEAIAMSITSSSRWALPINVVFDARSAVCAGVLAKVTSENLGYGGLVIRNLGNHVYSIKSDGFANGTGDFSGAILMDDGTGWSGSDMIKYNVNNATCPEP